MAENPKVKSWQKLFYTQQKVFTYLSGCMVKNDCTIPRFRILYNLYFNGAHTPIQLTKKLNVSRANITTFLSRLKSDKLVQTSDGTGTEKRPAYVLSKKGEKYFEEILPQHIERIEQIFIEFPDEFLKILDAISDQTPEK